MASHRAVLISHSAGVKDSALTTHGHLQAERLGQYLAQRGLRFTHIFSSDLERAHKTAKAICSAQGTCKDDEITNNKPKVQPLVILREQDFGFYEGKPFYARPRESNRSGKKDHRSQHQNDPEFKDVESKESMAARMDQYLREHLLPNIVEERHGKEAVVAIVSHGIILSHLWRCFLKCFPKNSVALSPGLSVGKGGVTPVEYLGGWSNTGYLELKVVKSATPESSLPTSPSLAPPDRNDRNLSVSLPSHKVVVKVINGKEHLVGLKRTRGVGSSQFDEGQKKIDTFFKKPKK